MGRWEHREGGSLSRSILPKQKKSGSIREHAKKSEGRQRHEGKNQMGKNRRGAKQRTGSAAVQRQGISKPTRKGEPVRGLPGGPTDNEAQVTDSPKVRIIPTREKFLCRKDEKRETGPTP